MLQTLFILNTQPFPSLSLLTKATFSNLRKGAVFQTTYSLEDAPCLISEKSEN